MLVINLFWVMDLRFYRFTTNPSPENKWYYLYSPCAEFSEFVGENNTGFIPCVNASVSTYFIL